MQTSRHGRTVSGDDFDGGAASPLEDPPSGNLVVAPVYMPGISIRFTRSLKLGDPPRCTNTVSNFILSMSATA